MSWFNMIKRRLVLCLLPALALAACAGTFQAWASENLPTGEENPRVLVKKIITAEYKDEATVNHPYTVTPLDDGGYLTARVGFKDPSVQEVNSGGVVTWSFEGVQPVSAGRLSNGNTLIADSGVPARTPKLLEVTSDGRVAWEHSFASLAEAPRYAEGLANGNVLVTLPFMIAEIDRQNKTVWSYGSRGPLTPGGPGYLERPVMATKLPGGNILVVDRGFYGGRVLEINKSKQVVWQFGYRGAEKAPDGSSAGAAAAVEQSPATDPRFLREPSFAARTDERNTLITDLGNRRLLEVGPDGNIVRELDWSPALEGYPVMNTWQAVPYGDKLMLVLTLSNSKSRVLELDTAVLPAVDREPADSLAQPSL